MNDHDAYECLLAIAGMRAMCIRSRGPRNRQEYLEIEAGDTFLCCPLKSLPIPPRQPLCPQRERPGLTFEVGSLLPAA